MVSLLTLAGASFVYADPPAYPFFDITSSTAAATSDSSTGDCDLISRPEAFKSGIGPSISWIAITSDWDPDQLSFRYKTISYDTKTLEATTSSWISDGGKCPPSGNVQIVKILIQLQGPLSNKYNLRYRTASEAAGFPNPAVSHKIDNGWTEAGQWNGNTNSPAKTIWIMELEVQLTPVLKN